MRRAKRAPAEPIEVTNSNPSDASGPKSPAASWVTRALWIALPLTLGGALEEATADWGFASRAVVVGIAAVAWALGIVALFAPRPRSFTVLRVVAPMALSNGIGSVRAEPSSASWIAVAHAALAAVAVLSASVADRCADGASYGNERRHPLRLPPLFSMFFVPVAVAATIVGLTAGPWMLADARWTGGAIATLFGVAAALIALRSLVSLERRFVVFVPAGLVVSDSIVLVDPVLFPREHVVRMAPTDQPATGLPDARPGTLDLRLGTPGAVELVVDEAAPIPCRDGRSSSRTVTADTLLFAPLRPKFVLGEWQRRHRQSSRD